MWVIYNLILPAVEDTSTCKGEKISKFKDPFKNILDETLELKAIEKVESIALFWSYRVKDPPNLARLPQNWLNLPNCQC